MAAIELTRQTKDIIKSFRLSRELLDLINQECRYRNLDFSSYVRHAAMLGSEASVRYRPRQWLRECPFLGVDRKTFAHSEPFRI